MFWDKGYTPSQNIEALLEKESATVEEFLDDDDILLECRSQKKAIVNYFNRPDVIKRLIELIITEPSDDLPMAQRFRYANMACEILTLGLPSLDEKLLSDTDALKTLYSYLENEPPLNPLLSSFFSKTFSMLFTKKAEQDWFLYQQMCLKLLEYIKSQNNFLDLIFNHFTTPIIPDLIMQMMKNVEGGQLKRNLYEWLTKDKLVDRLIAILGNPQESDKHTNVAGFLCDLIQKGRSMRQLDEENDSFEPAFTGSNPILKTIESEATIEALLNVILVPNAQESAIVSGISVVLTLIRPIVFDEPDSNRMRFLHKREKDIHEQILTTVIRVIAPRLKDFNELLKNPPNKPEVVTTAAKLSPPFGMTRLQICRIFTVLLQTKNEEISKAITETDFFETLLALFKQYCWNNFLHNEVEKCLQLIFYTHMSNNNNSTQGSTIVNDGSFGKGGGNLESTSSFFDFVFKPERSASDNIGDAGGDGGGETTNDNESDETKNGDHSGDIEMSEKDTESAITTETTADEETTVTANTVLQLENAENKQTSANEMETDDASTKKLHEDAKELSEWEDKTSENELTNEGDAEGDTNENDTTKVQADTGPSALQTHIIVHCKLISKLIDCWQHNKDVESAERGRRLGYMGHLIKILKHITSCISKSEHIGALIESNLSDASELELWQSIINPNDGDFTKALATQSKMLANCNAHEAGDYSQPLPKEFLSDNSTLGYFMSIDVMNNLGPFSESGGNDNSNELAFNWFTNVILKGDNAENDIYLQFGPNIEPDDDDEDDENTGNGDGDGGGHSLFGKSAISTSALQAFGVTNSPWDNMDPFSDLTAATATTNSNSTPWAADFGSDNFADFDAHFSSFTNDLGESLVIAAAIKEKTTDKGNGDGNYGNDGNEQKQTAAVTDNETVAGTTECIGAPRAKLETTGYDNNANVEKSVTLETHEIGKFADCNDDADIDIGADDVDIQNEKAMATSLVRTLQSVMQDSEDDYEDDEGMWTKPLGGSAVGQDEQNDTEEEENDEKSGRDGKVLHTVHSMYTNGPSSKPELADTESIKQLNATNAEGDLTTHTATTASTTAHSNMLKLAAKSDSADAGERKPDNTKRTSSSTSIDAIADGACNATAAAPVAAASPTANAVEIAPTTT